MTELEISERFRVTRRTVRRWRANGFPPGILEIIQLHEGTHPAWPGFKIQNGVIHTPNGYSLSANEIQLQPWIIANYRTLFARSQEPDKPSPVKSSSFFPPVENENLHGDIDEHTGTKH